jgi:hypothetical protein
MPASITPIAMPTNASVDDPPPEHVHVEIESDAEVAGDEWREHRIVRLIRQHPVDLGSLESCIEQGVTHCDCRKRPRRHVRTAGIGGLPDADDSVLVA